MGVCVMCVRGWMICVYLYDMCGVCDVCVMGVYVYVYVYVMYVCVGAHLGLGRQRGTG